MLHLPMALGAGCVTGGIADPDESDGSPALEVPTTVAFVFVEGVPGSFPAWSIPFDPLSCPSNFRLIGIPVGLIDPGSSRSLLLIDVDPASTRGAAEGTEAGLSVPAALLLAITRSFPAPTLAPVVTNCAAIRLGTASLLSPSAWAGAFSFSCVLFRWSGVVLEWCAIDTPVEG